MKIIEGETTRTAFIEAIASVMGALLDRKVAVKPSTVPPEAGYVVAVGVRHAGGGVLYAHFDRSQADALAKRMADSAEELQPAAVITSLRELCGQALTTLLEQHPAASARPEIVSTEPWSDDLPWSSPANLELVAEGEPVTLRVALAGTLDMGLEAEAPAAQVSSSRAGNSPNIDVILDIDLPLVVRFGRTEMSIKELTALGPGALIDLGRSPDDPVDVMVSNQIVARGEVVTVAGSYGVRIRDVISPADRMRSIGMEV